MIRNDCRHRHQQKFLGRAYFSKSLEDGVEIYQVVMCGNNRYKVRGRLPGKASEPSTKGVFTYNTENSSATKCAGFPQHAILQFSADTNWVPRNLNHFHTTCEIYWW